MCKNKTVVVEEELFKYVSVVDALPVWSNVQTKLFKVDRPILSTEPCANLWN